MASFIALRKTFDLSSDGSPRLLVGRQNRDIPVLTADALVTTLKKHYDMSVDVTFDSNGGSSCENQTFVLGSTYKDLPTPKKTQHYFAGWTTPTGQSITEQTKVELSNTTLSAQWEYVDLGSDCTEYKVSCNSSYKNTGIYSATRYSSASAVYVDWGDGDIDKVDGNISKLSHEYRSAGVYNVKVSNNITNFAPSYNDSTWYNTTSQNRYTFKDMVKTGSRCTTMPNAAFYYCIALSSIGFLSSCWTNINSIPPSAFYYCQGIKTLSTLPSNIKTIGSYGFYYCSGLTGVQDLRNTNLTSLFNSYIFYYCNQVQEWKLPSTLSGMYFGTYTFGYNQQLSAIELPSTLTSIASYCFYYDYQLKSITIPQKVTNIGMRAFYYCRNLSAVDYQTTALTSIDTYAFYQCYNLRSLSVPDTVKYIGNYAYYYCYSSYATQLTLPSALTSIGQYAYRYCYNLRDIELPSSLTVINNYAFQGCYNLSGIVARRTTAPTVYANTFGNTASNNYNSYTGYNHGGSNILCTYTAATGYDSGYWLDPLQNATKCGFSKQYIDA